jgi:hypothetical protein
VDIGRVEHYLVSTSVLWGYGGLECGLVDVGFGFETCVRKFVEVVVWLGHDEELGLVGRDQWGPQGEKIKHAKMQCNFLRIGFEVTLMKPGPHFFTT